MAPLSVRALALAAAAVATSAAPAKFTNPVYNADSPDPGVAWDPVTALYWAATTTGGGPDRFLLHTSPDLAVFTRVGFVWPAGASGAPSWAVTDFWAPELHRVGGNWLLYFVGRTSGGQLSVGVASSSSGNITGPYVDSGAPLVTDATHAAMGQIDPTLFVDADGTPYVVWKTDGNAVGKPTPIRAARLTPNGTALAPGQPDWRDSQLITNDLPWEGAIVEAPWVVRFAQSYFLFYSANSYGSSYAVGVARADAVTGPYTKLPSPILSTGGGKQPAFTAPGHCSVLQVAASGGWAMVYHAYNTSDAGLGRLMLLDGLSWGVVPSAPGGGVWPAMTAGAVPTSGVEPVP